MASSTAAEHFGPKPSSSRCSSWCLKAFIARVCLGTTTRLMQRWALCGSPAGHALGPALTALRQFSKNARSKAATEAPSFWLVDADDPHPSRVTRQSTSTPTAKPLHLVHRLIGRASGLDAGLRTDHSISLEPCRPAYGLDATEALPRFRYNSAQADRP
jgi:hypothetical protein